MKKRLKFGLMLTLLFSVFLLTTGCFGGLDDAQKASATYINAFFAKSEKPTAEERYQKIVSVVSANYDNSPADPENTSEALNFIQKQMFNGISTPYFIADNPKQPQSDTRRVVIVRFPKGTFTEDVFSGGSDEDSYVNFVINKEGDEWKIIDMDDLNSEDREAMKREKIEWNEVEPTDYLN
jgi:uncharacterized UPF0160 family protein